MLVLKTGWDRYLHEGACILIKGSMKQRTRRETYRLNPRVFLIEKQLIGDSNRY